MPRVERGVVRLADHAAGAVQLGERLSQLGEPPEVVHRRVAAHVALTHERRAVDTAEDHAVATDVHGVGRVAGLHVELARRLGHLLQHPVGVELHVVALDGLPRGSEELERLRLHELDADLGHDPAPALVEDVHRIGREDLVTRHLVEEHPPLQGHPLLTLDSPRSYYQGLEQ